MKKHICECSGCSKTATVKLRNGHRICEDCAKALRRRRRSGKKPRYFFKEVPIGHLGVGFYGPGDPGLNVYNDVPVKL